MIDFYERKCLLILIMGVMLAMPGHADSEADEQMEEDIIAQLKNMGVGELIEVGTFDPEARSAARKVQKLSETAAALFVLTGEEIRRAGITSLAEALRMVPGIQTARISAHEWAISARGLNEQYASKLLVMIDGRTVYSPLRSEVSWNVQDMLMEDIDRIEVIRGPGASLWGANAVNGIINIISKPAENTHGNLVTAYAGHGEERGIFGMRHGGEFGEDGHYRVYGKFYEHDSFVDVQGAEQPNAWQMKHGGFRMDWSAAERDKLTLQGDIYSGFTDQQSVALFGQTPDTVNINRLGGLNLLTRWQRNLTDGDIILQAYYDRTRRDEVFTKEFRHLYDIDFQHRLLLSERQEFIWGLGFRYTYDKLDSSPQLSYSPERRHDSLFSAFVQDEFMLLPDRLRLTLGSKFEYNNYTGFELQPTTRLLWNLNDRHSLWTSVSRAVRTPSRVEEGIQLDVLTPAARMRIQGNPDLESEVLLAYELGHRFAPAKRFLLDTTLFYNEYDNLRTNEPVGFMPFPPPPTILFLISNQMEGEVYGLETTAYWQATENWKLVASYSYLDTQLHLKPGSTATEAEGLEKNSPHHQASLRSLLTLPHHVEFDMTAYYADNVANHDARRYLRLDLRLGWRPIPALDLSAGVRNLLDKQHREFSTGLSALPPSEVPRAFYLQLKYFF
ncbi:MAG: TonB-dependent receptor [Gammaproteobacteria bacterium]|nr:TonB-dependent receptor [Gammaproteobacteria bacterium]